MEHLLPPGAQAPIRASYYECDHGLKNTTVYRQLYSNILSSQAKPDGAIPQYEQAAWWGNAMYSQNPGNLWGALTRDFFFGIPSKILNANVKSNLLSADEGGVRYLTTGNLNRLLHHWNSRVEGMDGDDQAARLLVAKVVLSQSATILRHLSNVLFSTGTPETAWDDPAFLTHFACVMVHQAMVEACGVVLGLEVRAGNEYSLRGCLPLVYYNMKRENWCPSTVYTLDAFSDVDEMAYGYWLGSVQTTKDHGKCTTFTCAANQMAEDAAPGHVLSGGCSDCAVVSVPIQDVLDVIDAGAIPLLKVTIDSESSYRLTATAMNGQIPYVAVSHVWADGLGSVTSNSIRMCRLLELRRQIEQLEHEFRLEKLGFWADTLCVPVDPAHIGAREVQIRRMHEVYSLAWAVIIIDADFVRLERTADIKEVGMRVHLSAWASRLWTYQEGASNARLFLLTKNGLVHLTAVLEDVPASLVERDSLTSRLRAKLYSHMTFALGRWEAGVRSNHSPWSTDGNEKVFSETELDLRRRRDRIAQMLLYNIKARTTSRPDDEAMVIASSLDLDTSQIMAATPSERTMALIKTLPYPPANMLFAVGPRLPFSGFKWAPKTFLRSQGGGCFTAPLAELVPLTMEQIDRHEVGARRMCYLDTDRRGLWTFNPGILLPQACFPKRDDAGNDVLVFEIHGKAYSIRGCADDVEDLEACRRATSRIKGLLDEAKALVVLLAEFYPSDRHYTGVLVDVTSGSLHEKALDGVVETKVEGEFVMLVQFVNRIPKTAAREMSLAAVVEIDAFVPSSALLDSSGAQDRGTIEIRESDDIEGTQAQRQLLQQRESVPGVDESLALIDSHHHIPSRVGRERDHGTDQETEKYVPSVVQALSTAIPEEPTGMYSATWLEPRFWLVD